MALTGAALGNLSRSTAFRKEKKKKKKEREEIVEDHRRMSPTEHAHAMDRRRGYAYHGGNRSTYRDVAGYDDLYL